MAVSIEMKFSIKVADSSIVLNRKEAEEFFDILAIELKKSTEVPSPKPTRIC